MKKAAPPTLRTARLLLNQFDQHDAPSIKRLITKNVAKTTLNLPYPYALSDAERWIATHQLSFLERKNIVFALRLQGNDRLIGAIGITLEMRHNRGEIGYWLGEKYWNKGYCTEAAREVLRYCFRDLSLNKVFARHQHVNPASGKVMEKIGMKKEGYLQQHYLKNGRYMDSIEYGLLRSDYISGASARNAVRATARRVRGNA